MNKISSYYYVIIGSIWIIFIFWNRFLRDRPERSLEYLEEKNATLIILLFILFVILFILRAKHILSPSFREFTFPAYSWVKRFLNSPSETYEYFRRKTPFTWGAHWLNLFFPLVEVSMALLETFIFLFHGIPITIPPLLMLCEIAWGGPLKYFYHSLGLLSLPLFLRLIIYLGLREKDALHSYLRDQGLILSAQEGSQYRFTFAREYSPSEKDSLLSKYKFLLSMDFLFGDLKMIFSRYKNFSSLLFFLLYSLAWGSLYFHFHSWDTLSPSFSLPFIL